MQLLREGYLFKSPDSSKYLSIMKVCVYPLNARKVLVHVQLYNLYESDGQCTVVLLCSVVPLPLNITTYMYVMHVSCVHVINCGSYRGCVCFSPLSTTDDSYVHVCTCMVLVPLSVDIYCSRATPLLFC